MIDSKKNIPVHWKVKKLGEVCTYAKGKKPSLLSSIKTKENSIPYINIKAFEKGIYDEYTNGEKCNLCEDGDLLMVWDGARCGLIGKAKKGAVGSTLMKILPIDGLDGEYLYHFIDSKFHTINTNPKGVGIPHVEPNLLWSFSFPLPPLSEQKAIVEKIEKLFSELDKGVEELRTVLDQLKVYRQSLLKWAFEGKLTNENVVEGKLPKGWKYQELINVVDKISDGPFGSNLKTADYVDSGVRVIRLENIGELQFNNELLSFVSEEKYETIKKHTVTKGDIIFSSFISEKIRTVILPEHIDRAINKADCFLIRCNESIVDKKYLVYFLSTRSMYNQLVGKIHGATRPRINTTQLKQALIPIAPISEQQKIVEVLEEKLSVCDQMEHTIVQSLQQAESLRQSVLKQAFEGKLVAVQEEAPAYIPKKIPFYQAQLFGYIIATSANNNIDHGEMTLAKNAYLLDKIYDVPTFFNYQRWHLGPYPPEMKGVLNGGSLKQFFNRVDYHIELQNSDKLFKYTNPYEARTRMAMEELAAIFSQYNDKERPYQTELLATVCKVIEDIQTTDLKAVRASMKEWKIDLKTTKFKNKAEKFSESDTASCLNFIIARGWDKRLIN